MNLKAIMLSKIRLPQKDKCFDSTHMKYLKVVKSTETENRKVVTKGGKERDREISL